MQPEIMQAKPTIKATKQGFSISGNLVYSTVSDLIETGKQQIKQLEIDKIQIDLDSVERIDSAGVALLLGWKRECLLLKKSCYFQDIPQQAKSLLKTYNLNLNQ